MWWLGISVGCLAFGFVLIWWAWRSGLYSDTETARWLRRRKRK